MFRVLKQQLSSDAVVVLHVVERGLFNQIAREVTRLRREGADLRDERRATGTAEIDLGKGPNTPLRDRRVGGGDRKERGNRAYRTFRD